MEGETGPRDNSRSRRGVEDPILPIFRGVMPMPGPGRRGVIDPEAASDDEPELAGRLVLEGPAGGGNDSKILAISSA